MQTLAQVSELQFNYQDGLIAAILASAQGLNMNKPNEFVGSLTDEDTMAAALLAPARQHFQRVFSGWFTPMAKLQWSMSIPCPDSACGRKSWHVLGNAVKRIDTWCVFSTYLQSTQANGPQTLDFGTKAIMLGTLEVQVLLPLCPLWPRSKTTVSSFWRWVLACYDLLTTEIFA